MKIIGREECDYIRKRNVWYEFDSLREIDEIMAVLTALEKQGYSMKKYSIDLDHDHTDFIHFLDCASMDELLETLNRIGMRRVEGIDFVSEYAGTRVNGHVAPSSSKLMVSYPNGSNIPEFEYYEVTDMDERLKQQLAFSLEIDKAKNIFRQTHLSGKGRNENDAEHSWHMAVMAYLLQEYSNEKIDVAKVMLMCLIHDIVEIDAGDTYAYDAENLKTKAAREEAAKERIFSMLPEDQKKELVALFDEFEAYETAESKFAHAMDNLQPLMLNDSNGGNDWKEHGVGSEQVYKRQSKTKLGSEKLFEVTDAMLQRNIERGSLRQDYTFRACNEADTPFLLDLKEKSFRWYLETLYGWNTEVQTDIIKKEMDAHLPDMKIIQCEGKDAGIFTFFYDEKGDAFIELIAILPEYRGRGIASRIIKKVLEENKGRRVHLQTYRENPARELYQKLGFKKYGETETHWLMEVLPE